MISILQELLKLVSKLTEDGKVCCLPVQVVSLLGLFDALPW
jgi:hypothetical protein